MLLPNAWYDHEWNRQKYEIKLSVMNSCKSNIWLYQMSFYPTHTCQIEHRNNRWVHSIKQPRQILNMRFRVLMIEENQKSHNRNKGSQGFTYSITINEKQ